MRNWINLIEEIDGASFSGFGYIVSSESGPPTQKPSFLCCAPQNAISYSYSPYSGNGYLQKYKVNARNPLRAVGRYEAHMTRDEIKSVFGFDDSAVATLIQMGEAECQWEDDYDTFCVADFVTFPFVENAMRRKGYDIIIYVDDGDSSAVSEVLVILDPTRISYVDEQKIESGTVSVSDGQAKTGPLF